MHRTSKAIHMLMALLSPKKVMHKVQLFPNILLVNSVFPLGIWGSGPLQSSPSCVHLDSRQDAKSSASQGLLRMRVLIPALPVTVHCWPSQSSSLGLDYLIHKIRVLKVLTSEALTFWQHQDCARTMCTSRRCCPSSCSIFSRHPARVTALAFRPDSRSP